MTSSLSKYEGKLPSPFNFFIQGHFRSILLDGLTPAFMLNLVNQKLGISFSCYHGYRRGHRRGGGENPQPRALSVGNFPTLYWTQRELKNKKIQA